MNFKKVICETNLSNVPENYTGTVYLVTDYAYLLYRNTLKLCKEVYYYKNGMIHSENGPARIMSDGTEEYYFLNQKVSESFFIERKIHKYLDNSIFILFLLCFFLLPLLNDLSFN